MPPYKMVAMAKEREDETVIIARWQVGGTLVWHEVMEKFRARVYATALRILHNEQDAEEITQDSFIAAHRNLINFRGDSSIATWLCTICTRKSLNRYHYRRRRKYLETQSIDAPVDDTGRTLADFMFDHELDPRARIGLGENVRAIAAAIQILNPMERTLILDRASGATYEQLAERYEIECGTVKSRLARARAKLIEILKN